MIYSGNFRQRGWGAAGARPPSSGQAPGHAPELSPHRPDPRQLLGAWPGDDEEGCQLLLQLDPEAALGPLPQVRAVEYRILRHMVSIENSLRGVSSREFNQDPTLFLASKVDGLVDIREIRLSVGPFQGRQEPYNLIVEMLFPR